MISRSSHHRTVRPVGHESRHQRRPPTVHLWAPRHWGRGRGCRSVESSWMPRRAAFARRSQVTGRLAHDVAELTGEFEALEPDMGSLDEDDVSAVVVQRGLATPGISTLAASGRPSGGESPEVRALHPGRIGLPQPCGRSSGRPRRLALEIAHTGLAGVVAMMSRRPVSMMRSCLAVRRVRRADGAQVPLKMWSLSV